MSKSHTLYTQTSTVTSPKKVCSGITMSLLLPLLVREDSHYLNKRPMLSFFFWGQPCFIIVHFVTLHTITSESKFQTGPKRWFWATRFISFWGNRTNVSQRWEGKGQRVLFFQPNEWSDLHKVTLIYHRTSFHFFPLFSSLCLLCHHVLHASSGLTSCSHTPTLQALKTQL